MIDQLEGMRQAILLLARINHMKDKALTPGPAHSTTSLEQCEFPTCKLFQEYLSTGNVVDVRYRDG